MGEIRIDIPRDLERAFEAAFAGEDKAAAVLRVIREEIARRERLSTPTSTETLLDEILAFGSTAPSITDDEIRRIREELRA